MKSIYKNFYKITVIIFFVSSNFWKACCPASVCVLNNSRISLSNWLILFFKSANTLSIEANDCSSVYYETDYYIIMNNKFNIQIK